jgi:hypothetical protein
VKVLHIVLGLQIGGLERFVLDLCAKGAPRVDSTILCLDDPTPSQGIDDKYSVIRWDKPTGLQPGLALKIARFVRDRDVDIIHTHNPAPHLYGALAGLISRRPVIHTKHGRNYPGQSTQGLAESHRLLAQQLRGRCILGCCGGLPRR